MSAISSSSLPHRSVPAAVEAPNAAITLAGRAPDAVAAPLASETPDVVAWARETRTALVPCGGGTRIAQGNRLQAARWCAVQTARMNRIEEYSPDDMVITAEAGVTLAALQAELAKCRQFLPIDVPGAEQSTLGGIVASNAHGLWRAAFGTPRDRLLGVRIVLADGSVVRGGGKVVKNVAGYDLCKLFAGSWGTLGIVTEVTFKTNPVPEARGYIAFRAPSLQRAAEGALHLHGDRLQPVYAVAHRMDDAYLYVGLMGSSGAVGWQTQSITERLAGAGLEPTDPPLSEDALREVMGTTVSLATRLTAPPSDVPVVVDALDRAGWRVSAQIPVGVIDAWVAPDDDRPAPERMAALDTALRDVRCHRVWRRLPAPLYQDIDVWGPTRADFRLMKGIKSALDPDRLFSPGRFVGRL